MVDVIACDSLSLSTSQMTQGRSTCVRSGSTVILPWHWNYGNDAMILFIIDSVINQAITSIIVITG
jgi:hypothetical protein